MICVGQCRFKSYPKVMKMNESKQEFIQEIDKTIELLNEIKEITKQADSWGTNRCSRQIRKLEIVKMKVETALKIAKLTRKGI